MSPEARLLALERRVYRLPVLDLERRAVALEQGLAQSWSWGVGYQTPTTPPALDPTLVYIRVHCWAEGGAAFSGCPVTIRDGSFTFLESGNTDATGTYVSAGYAPGTYYVVTSASGKTNISSSTSVTATGVYTDVNVLVFATGTTLTCVDSYYGNVTLAWNAGGGATLHQWTGTITTGAGGHPGSPACGSCPAWSGTPVTYTLSQGLTLNTLAVVFRSSTGGTPPLGCPANLGTTTSQVLGITRGAQVFTPGFSGTFNYNFSPQSTLYCNNAVTFTVTQP